jgi:enoyl-CoA hydratase/carnithine racemase
LERIKLKEKREVLKVDIQKHLAIVTLSRPEVLNAFNPVLWNSLMTAMEKIRDDNSIWVVIIRGEGGRAFSAGADLKWRAENETEVKSSDPEKRNLFFNNSKFEFWKPVIAAVEGYAVGGGLELALACDIIIASEDSKLGFPEPRRGLMADGGGVTGLIRQIPSKLANELIFSGKLITAEKGFEIGLINYVTTKDNLMVKAKSIADSIIKCSPLAVQAAKQAIVLGKDLPYDEALKTEFSMFKKLKNSKDFFEGPKAFSEKREPNWTME